VAQRLAGFFALLGKRGREVAFGGFARIFAKYVRDEHVLPVEEAIRKITSLPANVLSSTDRGRLKKGAFADIMIFDPTPGRCSIRPV
jgi:N-acyl-D-aspartate/D-glutamate deacylase